MPKINFDRELATKTFEYGNHTISVEVRIRFDGVWSHQNPLNYSVSLSNSPEHHYIREVKARARKEGTTELREEKFAVLDAEREVSRLFGGTKVKHEVPEVRDHISETVRPIFEELDTMYQFAASGESIDIEVATHEVQAETSWVEVEDEIDRLSQEIDALTERADG